MNHPLPFPPVLNPTFLRCRLLLLLLLLPGYFAALEQPYTAPSNLPVGSFLGSSDIVIADLDGDGDLDAVAAAANSNKIIWLEYSLQLGWSSHTVASSFDGVIALSVGDLDQDGDLDIVGASPDLDSITWWENPTWTSQTITAAALGVSSVTTADMDGDGDLDVLASLADLNFLGWWENPSWSPHSVTSSAVDPTSVLATDVDGDGDLDISAAATGIAAMSWWENTAGDGLTWSSQFISAQGPPSRIDFSDIDGDGDPDLLAAGTAGDLAWFENDVNGLGTWSVHPIDTGFEANDLVSVDMDRDGDIDLVAGSSVEGSVRWWDNLDGQGDTWTDHELATGISAFGAIAAGDLTRRHNLAQGRGWPSILYGWNAGVILLKNANLAFEAQFDTPPDIVEIDLPNPSDLEAADLDGDGDLDLLAAGSYQATSYFRWYENTGTYFQGGWPQQTLDATQWGFADSIAAGDLDNDGDLDVVGGADGTGTITRWFQNLQGDASVWSLHDLTGPTHDLEIGDLDGDGDLDVAFTYFNLGWVENPTIGGGVWTSHLIPSTEALFAVELADFDGDGDLDILGNPATPDLWWFENAGNGALWTEYALGMGGDHYNLEVVDVDADGDWDILGQHVAVGAIIDIVWWEHPGLTTGVWIRHEIAANHNSGYISTGDLDRDGDVDFLATLAIGNEFAWWEMTTAIPSWETTSVQSIVDPGPVLAVDLDSDGDTDYVGTAPGTVMWWPNVGGQYRLETEGTGLQVVENGQEDDLLKISPSSESGIVELVTFEFVLANDADEPLTSPEANALLEDLSIYLDDGSGTFDPADTLVTSVTDIQLVDGVQVVSFADDDPNVQIEWQETKDYFVTIHFTAYASFQATNQLKVTHLAESGSTAENAPYDTPLTKTKTVDLSSGTVDARPVPGSIFADGFESGSASSWSSCDGCS